MKELTPIATPGRRWFFATTLVIGLASLGGCRICADCEDLAYPAYGGVWQRTSRDSGRVGSVFDPGGAKASDLTARDTPPKPDELDRQRQEERGDKVLDPDQREGQEAEPGSDERDDDSKENELRDRKLEDIEEEKEGELRKRGLDDINIRLIPGEPIPPVLR